jgi:hypothetical protein
MIDATDPARLTQWGRSGCERADLVRLMHEDDDTCAVCGLDTFVSSLKVSNVATLGHVVPPSMIPNGTGRCGYVGGNLILTCRACGDAVGIALKSGASVDLYTLTAERAAEWLTLPKLDRFYVAPVEDGARLGYIMRASQTHREDAREARAERGLSF